MEKTEAFKFFVRFLLLTIITVISVGISVLLTSSGTGGVVIGGILLVINVFLLLFSLVIAITKLFKHIFDKNKEHFDYLYIVNVVFAGLITGIFLTFYFVILAGVLLVLLPLLS